MMYCQNCGANTFSARPFGGKKKTGTPQHLSKKEGRPERPVATRQESDRPMPANILDASAAKSRVPDFKNKASAENAPVVVAAEKGGGRKIHWAAAAGLLMMIGASWQIFGGGGESSGPGKTPSPPGIEIRVPKEPTGKMAKSQEPREAMLRSGIQQKNVPVNAIATLPGVRIYHIAVSPESAGSTVLKINLSATNDNPTQALVPEISVRAISGNIVSGSWNFQLANPILNPDETTTLAVTVDPGMTSVDLVRVELKALMATAEFPHAEKSSLVPSSRNNVPTIAAPSFDCSKASNNVERMICGNERLSDLDRNLGSQFRELRGRSSNPDGLRREQNQWIRERNRCGDEECIEQAYDRRISAIQKQLE